MAETTQLQHRALLALVREGPDEAAAAAVTAFAGDINAFGCRLGDETVLYVAFTCVSRRPLTVAALAARGDCNPNVFSRYGEPVLCRLVCPYSYQPDIATFLAHFPTANVNVCDASGDTPLHYAARWGCDNNAQVLLDAGADPTICIEHGLTPAQCAHRWGHRGCTKLLEAAEAWHIGLRREWLRAVVYISKM